MRRSGFAVALAFVSGFAGCTSSGPTLPTPANVSGSWLDNTDFTQSDLLTIQQNGSSVVVVSPGDYVDFAWGSSVWSQLAGRPDTASGTVVGDSIALCDPQAGGACPNEIAYLRNGSLVLYFTPASSNPADTAGLGSTFIHSTRAPSDTIAPVNAPPAANLSGVWRSDSVSACPAIAEIGLVVPAPYDSVSGTLLQLNGVFYMATASTRQCGDTSWSQQSVYFMINTTVPCTPADNCTAVFLDTVASKNDEWFLRVAGADSLADETVAAVNTGPLPPYFLRDSGATSLSRIRPPQAGHLARARVTQQQSPVGRREIIERMKAGRTRVATARRRRDGSP